jgi:peptidoglycan hydrolase-like protein with peptidoglycan-binding domain
MRQHIRTHLLLLSTALLAACSGGANAPTSARYTAAPPPGSTEVRPDQTVAVVLADEDGVRAVRQRLAELGFRPGPISNTWDSDVQSAVEAFQQSRGLPAGPLNRTTLNAMGLQAVPLTWTGPVVATGGLSGLPNDADAAPGRVQVGAVVDGGRGVAGAMPAVAGRPVAGAGAIAPASLNRAEAREVQLRLRDRRLYRGDLDGIWGPLSRQALLDFQRGNGLPADGQIDARTAAALGLDMGRLGAGTDGTLRRIGPSGGTIGDVRPPAPGQAEPRPGGPTR